MKSKTKSGAKITALVLVFIILLYATLVLLPKPRNYSSDNTMMKSSDMPTLIAHGGGNREFPDNTLEAFYNAYSVDEGVMMETDVSITADGVVILSHDTRIDRKTNKTGYISDWNYSDLISERVDFSYTNKTKNEVLVEGSTLVKFKNDEGVEVTPLDVEYPLGVVPRDGEVFLATTLEELLLAFPNNKINVEIKQEGEVGKRALQKTLELLSEHNAYDRVVLASFHDEIYDEFKRLKRAGEVPAEFMFSPGTSGAAVFFLLHTVGLDFFFRDEICVLQLPTEYEIELLGKEITVTLATEALIKKAHAHNLAVHFWTIDDKETMRYLIGIGADGIMTNYPHRLAEVYAEYSE